MISRTAVRSLLRSHFETPAARLLAAVGLSPNAVSMLGLLIAVGSACLLGAGRLWMGGAVLICSGLFDLLDGALARHAGVASKFGALLDSTLDRAGESAVLIGLLVHYVNADSTEGALLCGLALAGSFTVSYTRARAEGLGIDCTVGIMTRPERVAVLAAGLIAGHWWPVSVLITLGLIAGLTLLTSAQRLLHARSVLGSDL